MMDLGEIDVSNPPEGLFVHKGETRFDELDALWVLHHSRLIAHAERLQQAWFDAVMAPESFDPERYPDLYVVVKNVNVTYEIPMKGVGPYRAFLWVFRLREAGLTTGFEFWNATGTARYCRGIRTVCRLSTTTHQPCGWTPSFRSRVEPWAASGKAFAT